MYTKEQIEKAIETYKVIGTVTATITRLGYPSRQALYEWLHNYGLNPSYKNDLETLLKPRKKRASFSADFKLNAIKRCFENEEEIKKVAKELGISRPCLYNWRKKYLKGGMFGLMKKHEINRGPLNEPTKKDRLYTT